MHSMYGMYGMEILMLAPQTGSNFLFSILFQMTEQCPMDLDSLSSIARQPLINGSNLNLPIIYKSALISSIHFRYMAEDWIFGESCINEENNLKLSQAFQRYLLYDLKKYKNQFIIISFFQKKISKYLFLDRQSFMKLCCAS